MREGYIGALGGPLLLDRLSICNNVIDAVAVCSICCEESIGVEPLYADALLFFHM